MQPGHQPRVVLPPGVSQPVPRVVTPPSILPKSMPQTTPRSKASSSTHTPPGHSLSYAFRAAVCSKCMTPVCKHDHTPVCNQRSQHGSHNFTSQTLCTSVNMSMKYIGFPPMPPDLEKRPRTPSPPRDPRIRPARPRKTPPWAKFKKQNGRR